MNEEVVGLEPQKTQEGVTPTVTEETVSLSKAEHDELKHKAEVSSQNFERAKKAETEAKELRERLTIEVPSDSEVFTDEGKHLESKIGSISSEVSELKSELAKERLINSNPIFKERWAEFEEFRTNPDNKGMNLNTAAKSFLVENGLLEPTRKGLEKTTGGLRTPPTAGMTPDEVKRLRETNYKEYVDKLTKGLIQV